MSDLRVLVLEDDLEALEHIMCVLKEVSLEIQKLIGVTVLPDYVQTEEFVNKNPQIKYDILRLDRDCFLGGSFHTVNLNNFDKDKVISISSVPDWNKEAKDKGIRTIVYKDFDDLEYFHKFLKREILRIITDF
jgi:hypothetical protein